MIKLIEYPTRPGITTLTDYSCGHSFTTTTAEPKIYDPAGILAEIQERVKSTEPCGRCDEVRKHDGIH